MVFDGHRDVDRRKQAEDQGLHDDHQAAEQIERDREEPEGEREEDGEDRVVRDHVRHQADAEGEGAREVADELDREHQRREPEDRPEEVLEVRGSRSPSRRRCA